MNKQILWEGIQFLVRLVVLCAMSSAALVWYGVPASMTMFLFAGYGFAEWLAGYYAGVQEDEDAA